MLMNVSCIYTFIHFRVLLYCSRDNNLSHDYEPIKGVSCFCELKREDKREASSLDPCIPDTSTCLLLSSMHWFHGVGTSPGDSPAVQNLTWMNQQPQAV